MKMSDEEHISFPNKNIVDCEIKTIVAKGVMVPEPLYKHLYDLYMHIGIRYLLRDTRELVVAITMITILMTTIVLTGQEQPNSNLGFYGIIMLVSPIMYGFLSLIPFITSKVNGTVEVEMTCKYNLYQLAAFRMLVFSVFCFLLNTIWVMSLAVRFSSIQFVQAFMISTTSLFLFSLLFLYVIRVLKTVLAKATILIGWMGLNVLLVMIDSYFYHQLLVAVPWYLYGVVICLTAFLYLIKMKEFMLQQKRRGAFSYANCQ